MFYLKKFILNYWYRKFPPPMVMYWRTKESVAAKVTTAKEGHLIMELKGEKYPFPGFPRGHVLFNTLSPLKHNIKNKIFNESWALLEKGADHKEISAHIRQKFDEIIEMAEKSRFDMLPYEKMPPAVKEIWRAWSTVEGKSLKLKRIKEILCFILTEDDGYRFRVQYIFGFMNRFASNTKQFEKALNLLEHAEIIGDMKERIRLLRTILLIVLKDERICTLFNKFMKEIDHKKVRLSKADKYYLRGKYFKADYPFFEY